MSNLINDETTDIDLRALEINENINIVVFHIDEKYYYKII